MSLRMSIKRRGAPDNAITGFKSASAIEAELLRNTRSKLTLLWRDAIREFIRGAVKAFVDSGSVDTGMSLASFLPLARALVKPTRTKVVGGVGIIMSGISHKKRGPRYNQYFKYPAPPGSKAVRGMHKSIAQGERDGRDAFTVSVGPPSAPHLHFEFHITVFQHFIHESEVNNANSKTIISLEKGRDAMRAFIRTNYKRYISTADYRDIILQRRR